MSETRTLWQRCEALGQFEDYKNDDIEIKFSENRWVMRHNEQLIIFIYEDKIIGSEWLADAILSHLERIRFGTTTDSKTFCQEDLNRAGIANVCRPIPDQLPDVTYVVEAPKATDPTQEQLKAIWDHVTHLTMEQEISLGIQYAFVGTAMHSEFQLHIKSVASCKEQWRVRIAQGSNGVFRAIEPFDLALACHRLGCFHVANSQVVVESPLQFVSIPVQDWQEVLEAFMSLSKVLNSHTA